MNATTHLKIGEINKNLICILCRGYYIDATTIIECLHSFCRTCIVTYLKTSKTCPVCDTVVHKTRPHQNIRSDKLLQDLVYKLVPGLYKDEMKRRREFYTRHYYAAPKRSGEERGDEMCDRFIYTEEEKISLTLHLCREGASERVDFRQVFTSREDLKARVEKRIKEAVDVRFLQCKAAVTVGHLKKFVRLKYGLPSHFQVDMFYNDVLLRNNCTLCDVAYFFNWRRRAPMTLTFCVYDCSSDEPTGKQSSLLTNSTSIKKKTEASLITPSITAFSSSASQGKIHNQALQVPSNTLSTNHKSPIVSSALSGHPADDGSTSHQQTTVENCRQAESNKNIQVNSSLGLQTPSSESPAFTQDKTGSKKRGVRTSSSLLGGKRPAKTPIPIAPAPAKVPRVFPYVMNIVESGAQVSSEQTREPCQMVGLLPMNTTQNSASSASPSRGLETPTSTLRFSMASILQVVTGANSTATSSSSPCNNKQAVTSLASPHSSRAVAVTSGTPMSSMLLPAASSCQVPPVKSKNGVSLKAQYQEKKKLTKDLVSSSTSLSISHSRSASSTVTITQTSHNNSVGSPTPAASASPTPAAVPIQQSQTQGSDMLTTNLNCVTEHPDSNTHSASTHPQNTVTTHHTDIKRPTGFYRETIDLQYSETVCAQKSKQALDACRTQCGIQEPISENIKIKSEVASSPTTLSKESTYSCHSDKALERNPNSSSTSLTPSPLSDTASASCVMRKQVKHKKIADIANTLQKRVSDALLHSATPRSNSPSSRRSSQSSNAGGKTLNKMPQTSDVSRAPPSSSSSHKAPQNGTIFVNATSAHANQNNQADEPLNLVKRDMNTVRNVPSGMFVLDTKQTVKKHINL
ncbi:hypothetical protein BsWGS_05167 [Bradybaena similaris]